jgi:hypothetical protein
MLERPLLFDHWRPWFLTGREFEMLFMVELNHGPETCVAGKQHASENYAELLDGLRGAAAEYGADVVGGWAFPVGHKLWYVVDAEESQTVADLFFASGLHQLNTIQINPVLDHDAFTGWMMNFTDRTTEVAI